MKWTDTQQIAEELFDKYSENHQNPTNKLIHWVCVPLIVFSFKDAPEHCGEKILEAIQLAWIDEAQ